MKILLDTTYYLPAIGVQIEGLPSNLLQMLLHNQNFQLYYCEITLFELAAKGVKLAQSDETLTVDDIMKGIDSIRWDNRLKKLTWYSHPFVLELSTEIRRIHTDFIDCLILATAVCYSDTFALYDETLFNKISKNRTLLQKILEFNQNFCFWLSDLSKEPIQISSI